MVLVFINNFRIIIILLLLYGLCVFEQCKKIRDMKDDILDETDFKQIAEANNMSVVEMKQKLKQKTQDMEKTFRVATELSDCIVICQTAPFKSFEHSANERK